jgi:hypothetical protein
MKSSPDENHMMKIVRLAYAPRTLHALRAPRAAVRYSRARAYAPLTRAHHLTPSPDEIVAPVEFVARLIAR